MIAILEGLLYVQGDLGLTIEQVVDILGVDTEEAKKLIYDLKQSYENNDRGLRINYLGNTFKLTTKKEHKEYYQKLITDSKTQVLSNSALEVLAIIAYNEPISRIEVDKIRGIDSAYLVRRLLAKGLIKESGKSNLPGKPTLYKTTDDFLDYFGLSSKEELPKLDLLEEELDNEKDLFKSKYIEKEEILWIL